MIYFLVPVYNESANLYELAKNLTSALPNEEKYFVFVDDKSTDDTVEVITHHFISERLEIIEKTKNGGPGDSFNLGMNWIIENSTNPKDLVVTVEGDNTSDVGILNNMIVNANLGYDLVLASVYAQGGGFDKTSTFRKLISFIANMAFRALFNLKVLTMSSFYRVYSLEVLKKIKKEFGVIISEPGFICMLEILLKSIKLNARTIEVPMILKSDKRVGKSKMKIFKTTMGYLRFLFKNYARLKT